MDVGSYVLSVGSYGCNLSCPFCQNHEIAAARADTVAWRYDGACRTRCRSRAPAPARGNVGIAFTYNEPLIGWEFVRDTARLAHERGLKTVVVSNGVVCADVWRELPPLVDACNIDLSAASDEAYARLGAGVFETVVDTIRAAAPVPPATWRSRPCAPRFIDADSIDRLARLLASIDPSIPYHVTQYVPRWRMTGVPAAPTATVRSSMPISREIGSATPPPVICREGPEEKE